MNEVSQLFGHELIPNPPVLEAFFSFGRGMTQLMKILRQPDPLGQIVSRVNVPPLGRNLISRDPGNIRLEGYVHQVVHRPDVILDAGKLNVQLDLGRSGRGFFFRPETVVGNFSFPIRKPLKGIRPKSLDPLSRGCGSNPWHPREFR